MTRARRASRRSAAAFSLRRRAALSGPARDFRDLAFRSAFRARTSANPQLPSGSVSQLLAGDRCVPERSPDTARVRGCESRPRAPPQSEARNCRAPAAGRQGPVVGPRLSGLLRHHDASRWHPQGGAGCWEYRTKQEHGQGLFSGNGRNKRSALRRSSFWSADCASLNPPYPSSANPRSSHPRSALNAALSVRPRIEIEISGTNMSTVWKLRAARTIR